MPDELLKDAGFQAAMIVGEALNANITVHAQELHDICEKHILTAVAFEREACAQIAKDYLGNAAKDRRERGLSIANLEPEAKMEIDAEKRGEDIAAWAIHRAINARDPTIAEQVRESLNNAAENGYDMRKWGVYKIAYDLLGLDSDLGHLTVDHLAPHIRAWLKDHPKEG